MKTVIKQQRDSTTVSHPENNITNERAPFQTSTKQTQTDQNWAFPRLSHARKQKHNEKTVTTRTQVNERESIAYMSEQRHDSFSCLLVQTFTSASNQEKQRTKPCQPCQVKDKEPNAEQTQ